MVMNILGESRWKKSKD